MSSYRQHLYHLVFRTKDSLPAIKQDHANELYAYITGMIKHKNSHLCGLLTALKDGQLAMVLLPAHIWIWIG